MADGNVDLATLGIVVRGDGIELTRSALAALAKQGDVAEAGAKKLAQAHDVLAKAGRDASSAMLGEASGARQMAEQIKQAEAAMGGATSATNTLAAAARKAHDDLATIFDKSQLDFVGQWVAGAKQVTAAHGEMGKAANLNRVQQMELLHVGKSVFDSLSAGANPVRVLAMESGRLAQVVGEGKGGVAGGLKILGAFFTSTAGFLTVASAGFLAVAAGALAFDVAVDKSREHLEKLGDLSRGVGAAMGLTAQGITAAGDAGARTGDLSRAAGEAMAEAYAKGGQVGADVLQQLVAHTNDYAKATGEDAKTAAKEFGAAMADPAKGATELNDKFHVLNETQLEHIKLLAESGNKQQAQGELMRALEPVWDDQTKHVGGLVGMLKDVVTWAQNAGHALVQAASGDTRDLASRIFDLQKQSAAEKAAGGVAADHARSVFDPQIAQLQAQLRSETARADTAAANTRSTAAGAVYNAVTPGAGDLDKLNAQLDQTKARLADLTSPAQQASEEFKRLTETQERLTHAVTTYKDPAQKQHDIAVAQAEAAGAHTAAAKALAAQHLATAKAEGEAKTATELHTEATDAATLASDRFNASHKSDPIKERIAALNAEIAGNRGIAEAYDLSTSAGFRAAAGAKALADAAKTKGEAARFERLELDALVTTTEKEAAQSIQALRSKTAAEVQANDIMRATGVSQAEANRQVADSVELEKLRAAQSNASGVDILILGQQIRQTADAQRDKNEADRDAYAIQAHNAAGNQLEQLRLEGTLIGASNQERTVRLALLKAEQALKAQGITDPADPRYQQGITDAKAVANQTASNAAAQALYNSQLHQAADLWGEISQQVNAATANFADYFGTFGAGMAQVLQSLAAEAKSLEDLKVRYAEAEKAKNTVEMANLDRQASNIRIKAYGDTAAAAADMFGKQTAAYKVLHAAEEAFRIFQLAMQAKAVIGYFAEAAAHTARTAVGVTNDAISTASTTAKDTTAAATGAAAGAAQMFADLGPLGFAAVAAMTAVLAGFALSAGKGGGSVPGANDFKDRQAAQGTGSVLGDASAKSESIARSLDLVAKNTNSDLEYSNSMLTALRSIDTNIGSLTAALARSLGVGGQLDTSGLGLGTSASGPGLLTRIFAPISNLLPGLFGSKSTTTLQDQGLQFTPQSLGDIIAKGINGSIYQQTSTETKSKFFGFTVSDKTSQNTATQGLDSQIADDMTRVIASLREGVLTAAGKIGIDGAQAVLDAFQLDLGKISLKDLKGQDLSNAISAVFSKAADDMAAAVDPAIAALQHAGEGAFETLTRLAKDYEGLDFALQAIGKTFGSVGVDSLAARENLIGLFGSLDDFTSATSAYAKDFISEADQLAIVQAAVTKRMGELGESGITTKDQFKTLIDGLDLTTAAGAQLYANLLAVAPAFAKVADAAAQHAADVASKAGDIQGQIDQLTLSSADLLAKTRAREMVAAVALDASLGPLQQHLYDLQDAASAAADAAKAAAQAQSDAAAQLNQAIGLHIRLAQAQGDTATVRQLQLTQEYSAATSDLARQLVLAVFATEDANTAMAAQQKAAQDMKAALDAAAQAQKALADEHDGLMSRLAQSLGDDATVKALARQKEMAAASDDLSRALLQAIYGIDDMNAALAAQKQAAEAAAQAQKAHEDQATTLAIRIAQARGDTAAATALQRMQELAAATDDVNRATLLAVYYLEDQKAANDNLAKSTADAAAAQKQAADAAQALADKNADLMGKLRGLQGDPVYAVAIQRQRELRDATDETTRALLGQIDAQSDFNDAQTKAADLVTKAQGALKTAYDAEAKIYSDRISKLTQLNDALKGFLKDLTAGPAALLSPSDQYASAKAAFEGNKDPNQIVSLGQDFQKASETMFAGTAPYFSDLAEIKAATQAAQGSAQGELEAVQAILDQSTQQVNQLIALNDNTRSVAQAVDDLAKAQGDYAQLIAQGVSQGLHVQALAAAGVPASTALQSLGVHVGFGPSGPDAATAAFLHAHGVPGFAGGGPAQAGYAWVGEQGPELVRFGQPAYVHTASQSRAMVSGNDNGQSAALLARIDKLIARVEAGMTQNGEIAQATLDELQALRGENETQTRVLRNVATR